MIIGRTRKKTKREVFSSDFVPYLYGVESYIASAGADTWVALLQFKGSFTKLPMSAFNERLEDYIEAAYRLGEISGLTTALKLMYDLGLAKDYLERPKVSDKLQKLAFEVYWLSLRLERTKVRRNESLAQKAADLGYRFYVIVERALKAAKAELPKSS